MYRQHLIFIILLSLILSILSCRQKPGGRTGAMLHFDLEGREVRYVSKDLEEISGISFLHSGMHMAAINDEEGKIYIIDFAGKVPTISYPFGKPGDYEDIVADDQYYYVLQSKGRIHRLRRESIPGSEEIFDLGKKDSDFETLYMDPGRRKLVMICKSCRQEEKSGRIPAYCFDPTSLAFEQQPCFTINTKKVRELLHDKYLECRPSAASIHPLLHKLFVLCSVGKLLLVCNLDGEVEEAFSLDPAFFPQPEGLCFSDSGDMFISNEGLDGQGTIIRFPYVTP